MVKRAFGAALVNHDDEIVVEKDVGEVLEATTKKLRGWIGDIQEREYVFGCHLCNVPDLNPLSIGTVLFEPRNTWLDRMSSRSLRRRTLGAP